MSDAPKEPLNDQQLTALGLMMIEGLRKKDPEIIKGCLAMGGRADFAVQNGSGGAKPLLHWAAMNFDPATAQVVLEATPEINIRDAKGNTAVAIAIENILPEAVEFLMKAGADPLVQNFNGVVPLDTARNIDLSYYPKQRDKIIKSLTTDFGHVARNDVAPQCTAPENQQIPPPPKPNKAFTL